MWYPGSVQRQEGIGQAGRRAAGHSVTRRPLRPTQRSLSISSISCSSSLAFHHQKYFGGVTQRAPASRSDARRALARRRSRTTLAASARKVRVFELERAVWSGRGARAAGPPMARRARPRAFPIGPARARQWPRGLEFEARRGSRWSSDRRASRAHKGDICSQPAALSPKRSYRAEQWSFCRLSLLRGGSRCRDRECARSELSSSIELERSARGAYGNTRYTSDLHPWRVAAARHGPCTPVLYSVAERAGRPCLRAHRLECGLRVVKWIGGLFKFKLFWLKWCPRTAVTGVTKRRHLRTIIWWVRCTQRGNQNFT